MYLQDFFLKHIAYSFAQPAPLLSVPIFAEKRKGFPLPIAIGIRAINNLPLLTTSLKHDLAIGIATLIVTGVQFLKA